MKHTNGYLYAEPFQSRRSLRGQTSSTLSCSRCSAAICLSVKHKKGHLIRGGHRTTSTRCGVTSKTLTISIHTSRPTAPILCVQTLKPPNAQKVTSFSPPSARGTPWRLHRLASARFQRTKIAEFLLLFDRWRRCGLMARTFG